MSAKVVLPINLQKKYCKIVLYVDKKYYLCGMEIGLKTKKKGNQNLKYKGLPKVFSVLEGIAPYGGIYLDAGIDNSKMADKVRIDVMIRTNIAYLVDDDGHVLSAITIPQYRADDLRKYAGKDYRETLIWVRDFLFYLANITKKLDNGIPYHLKLRGKEEASFRKYRKKIKDVDTGSLYDPNVYKGRKAERDRLMKSIKEERERELEEFERKRQEKKELKRKLKNNK